MPTGLRVLRGGKKREGEPRFDTGDISTPPGWLSEGAQREWRRMAPSLIAQKVLTEADRAAFLSYCECVSQIETATEALNREGFTCKSQRGGPRTSAWLRVRSQALLELRHWGAVFGLDPAARAKLATGTDDEGEAEFQRWVNSRGR